MLYRSYDSIFPEKFGPRKKTATILERFCLFHPDRATLAALTEKNPEIVRRAYAVRPGGFAEKKKKFHA